MRGGEKEDGGKKGRGKEGSKGEGRGKNGSRERGEEGKRGGGEVFFFFCFFFATFYMHMLSLLYTCSHTHIRSLSLSPTHTPVCSPSDHSFSRCHHKSPASFWL